MSILEDAMNDNDKSAIEKFVDTVGTAVKTAVMPTRDTETEALAENANEQIFLGGAAIAPEAIPAAMPRKTKKRRATPKKQPAKTPVKKSKKTASKKSAKKSPKKAVKKAAKKTAKKTKTAVKKKKAKRGRY
jgi:hypothetical protein